MPITTQNPIPDPAGDYDRLGIQLAISPVWHESDVGAAVAIRLTPYRVNADGTIEQSTDARSVVYGDAFAAAADDPALAAAVTQIMSALQDFITAKGI